MRRGGGAQKLASVSNTQTNFDKKKRTNKSVKKQKQQKLQLQQQQQSV